MRTAHAVFSVFLAATSLGGVEPAGAQGVAHQAHGVSITLLALEPDADGLVRGAIGLELEPGWKTYWIDPNGPGLAPIVDFSASTGVDRPQLRFPAPKRLEEGGESFIGYDAPVAIAFEAPARADGVIAVSLLVGICETLCVPVAANLRRDLREPASMEEAMTVDRAFLALPREPALAVTARLDGDVVAFEIPSGIGEVSDLFLAAPAGWAFGQPRPGPDGFWRASVAHKPVNGTAAPIEIEAIAVTDTSSRPLRIEIDPAAGQAASPNPHRTREERP